jgi:hypothetical protein
VGAWPNPEQLTEITCFSCRVKFAITADLYNARVNDHLDFWCPNGHQQHFVGDTAEKKRIKELEAQLQRERDAKAAERRAKESAHRQREWAESQARGANIAAGKAKAAKRRLEQRIAHGVCPCCHRTFKQLAAHMETKHPEYKGGAEKVGKGQRRRTGGRPASYATAPRSTDDG